MLRINNWTFCFFPLFWKPRSMTYAEINYKYVFFIDENVEKKILIEQNGFNFSVFVASSGMPRILYATYFVNLWFWVEFVVVVVAIGPKLFAQWEFSYAISVFLFFFAAAIENTITIHCTFTCDRFQFLWICNTFNIYQMCAHTTLHHFSRSTIDCVVGVMRLSMRGQF